MSRLPPDFRGHLKPLAMQQGWRLTKSSSARVAAERRPSDGVFHELWISPQTAWISDAEPLCVAANAWTHVVFEAIEQRITEILSAGGHDPNLTDRRTAGFSLNSLVKPGDPDCSMGYILKTEASRADQACDFWSFYWSRVKPELDRLSSSEILADPNYLPPFASRVAWSTRQLLWHALQGSFSAANQIATTVDRIARVDLTSSVRGLQHSAAERGHDFQPNPSALEYANHPKWLEFVAVREHVSTLC